MATYQIINPIDPSTVYTDLNQAVNSWVENIDVEADPNWQPTALASGEFTFYYFGPSLWTDTINKLNPNAGDYKYPLTAASVLEGFSGPESASPISVDAIGTSKRISASKYNGGSFNATRIEFDARNLGFLMYSFLIFKSDGSTLIDKIPKDFSPVKPSTWPINSDSPDENGPVIEYLEKNSDNQQKIVGLYQPIFRIPFGIAEIKVTPVGKIIESVYYENCFMLNQNHQVGANQVIVMTGVSGTFERRIPIAISTSA